MQGTEPRPARCCPWKPPSVTGDFDRERRDARSRLNTGASDRARHAYIHVIPGRGAGAGAAYECQYPMTQTARSSDTRPQSDVSSSSAVVSGVDLLASAPKSSRPRRHEDNATCHACWPQETAGSSDTRPQSHTPSSSSGIYRSDMLASAPKSSPLLILLLQYYDCDHSWCYYD